MLWSQKPPAGSLWWRRNGHERGLQQLGRRWKWATETRSQKQNCEEGGEKRPSSRGLAAKITRGDRVFFVTTHCSLLSHIRESHKQQKHAAHYAALQVPGSGDLTNSSASLLRRLTLFPEQHVRIVAVNPYISSRTQGPSVTSGAVLRLSKSPPAFPSMRVRKG